MQETFNKLSSLAWDLGVLLSLPPSFGITGLKSWAIVTATFQWAHNLPSTELAVHVGIWLNLHKNPLKTILLSLFYSPEVLSCPEPVGNQSEGRMVRDPGATSLNPVLNQIWRERGVWSSSWLAEDCQPLDAANSACDYTHQFCQMNGFKNYFQLSIVVDLFNSKTQ